MSDRPTGTALQSFLETYGTAPQSDTGHIPGSISQCCCGNASCAYLEHNQNALDDLERELQTSARLGQALLVRHETYMADAEQQRQAMALQMEELETEKKSLQRKNNSLVQENRGLLDQLEALNNAVAESDDSIAVLQETLASAQQETQRLAVLAARSENLERELALFEQEQATWQASLTAKEQAEKTAMRRWHDAERTLAKLQDELERIERESKEERVRHDEVVTRMERRHAVEKELVGAADRLKGNASSANSTVVSHFVKDILQDNATLQSGILELREMLQNSNEEVEKLREQLQLHQPIEENEERRPVADRTVSLGDELMKTKGQELHVHHHYHAPTAAPQRSNSLRRTKKKRLRSGSSTYLTPSSSGRSTPRSSISLGPGTAAAILRQTAASLPQDVPHQRWPSQSSVGPTYPVSVPSSPTTTHRTSSLFDRVFSDAGNESTSPPTSEGEAFSSPYFPPTESRRASASLKYSASKGHARGWGGGPGKQSLDSILDTSVEDLQPLDQNTVDHDAIEEEVEHWEDTTIESEAPASAVDDSAYNNRPWHRPALRRAASHESLLSISGMDIHTLRERPSQLLIPNSGISSGAIVSNFQVHAAKPTGTTSFPRNSQSILSGMAADQRKVSAPLPGKQNLTKKSSGWFFGRWGSTPESTEEPAARAPLGSRRASSIASSNSDRPGLTPKPSQLRSPGINQPGAILGFLAEAKISHPPVVKSLDQDALTKVLDTGK
ncbi:hypothetical protein AMS68_003724 [Peltaster fructicola]|uniref:Uncharacterized protein n=1 Tax=Peltaster fructicola TaxID=286661 RepID=A0A6H0XTV9_9PEZI|nr:hypothetical protein AMS68_003724 [Peltaster fructicola]